MKGEDRGAREIALPIQAGESPLLQSAEACSECPYPEQSSATNAKGAHIAAPKVAGDPEGFETLSVKPAEAFPGSSPDSGAIHKHRVHPIAAQPIQYAVAARCARFIGNQPIARRGPHAATPVDCQPIYDCPKAATPVAESEVNARDPE